MEAGTSTEGDGIWVEAGEEPYLLAERLEFATEHKRSLFTLGSRALEEWHYTARLAVQSS